MMSYFFENMSVKNYIKSVEITTGVKSQGVFLYADVLNKMMCSSVVGYLDGIIHCEGGM
jgi:hypothetical protein